LLVFIGYIPYTIVWGAELKLAITRNRHIMGVSQSQTPPPRVHDERGNKGGEGEEVTPSRRHWRHWH